MVAATRLKTEMGWISYLNSFVGLRSGKTVCYCGRQVIVEERWQILTGRWIYKFDKMMYAKSG